MKSMQIRGLSSDTFQLVRELYQKPGLFGAWNAQDRKVALIEQIERAGEPAAIRELIPFGLSGEDGVSDVAKSTIFQLFAKIDLETLPQLDDWLRQAWSLGDWHRLRPESLKNFQLKSDSDRVTLGLVASHRSGFVRAEAIRMMRTDTSEILIPFILIRLTDWVNEVRTIAESELRSRLQSIYARRLVECLSLIDRLVCSSRFREEYTRAIDDLLKSPECGTDLNWGMSVPQRSIRRHCFRLAVSNSQFMPRDIIFQALEDSDVLIRKWAFAVGLEALPADRNTLQERASKDAYGPVRRLAFEARRANANSDFEHFVPFLLDHSAAIRHECQVAVRVRLGRDPADFYRKQIHLSMAKAIDVCVLGLAETGTSQDGAVITSLLENSSVRVRRTALRALRILAAVPKSDYLLRLLSEDLPSVAREAAWTLLACRIAPPESVWNAAQNNPDHRVRVGVLKILKNAGKWIRLRLYLQALADSERPVYERAVMNISQWIKRFNDSFVQPSEEDTRIIPELVEAARDRLPSELRSELEFTVKTCSQ